MKGIISFAPKNVNEFNGIKTISFKIEENNNWFKIGGTEEQLTKHLEIITKGSEVEFEADDRNNAKDFKVIKFAPKSESGGNWSDDYSNFEDLLDAAHEGGLQSVKTEIVSYDFEKKTALVHATVTMVEPKNREIVRTFEAHGDTTMDNIKGTIQPHFIRMAETRALSRALRWATNNAKTAVEEMSGSDDTKPESIDNKQVPEDVTKQHIKDEAMGM